MVTVEGLIEAWLSCRKRKKRTPNAVKFEIESERKIVLLCDRINSRTYVPSKSVCFIVTDPKYREVFAADFEDRVVHHWVCLRLEPMLEAIFSPKTFNCRKGKGQLYGVNCLRDDIRECSEGYTKDCWTAKLDIKGFFMSIGRKALADMIDRFIVENYKGDDIDDLRYLTRTIVVNAPEENCDRHGDTAMWDRIPAGKSLFTNKPDHGLAIGNLPSQLLANFLLDSLDRLLVETLHLDFAGRYVDDFYIVDRSKDKILAAIPAIREHLKSLGLDLHPDKFYIQHFTKGIRFTGYVVKKDRLYALNRTVNKLHAAVDRLNNSKTPQEVLKAVESLNSYLGFVKHTCSYSLRRKELSRIKSRLFKYVYIKGHFDFVKVKKKYTPRYDAVSKFHEDPPSADFIMNVI